MPLRFHRLMRIIALSAEMTIHAGIFGLIAAAMFAQNAGVYEALQFSMDIAVMFTVVAFLFFRYRYEDLGRNRAPNVTCFSFILLFSLTGALGLAIRATSRSGFCEELLSARSEGCWEAGLVMAMSWTSVVTAIVGILVSSLVKYPGDLEATRLYAPGQRSTRELKLLKRPAAAPERMNTPPRIRVLRPPPASYEAARSRKRGDYMEQIRSLVPARSFPKLSHRFSSHKDSSSPLKINELPPLMLRRKLNGEVGQASKDQSPFSRNDELPIPIKLDAQKVDERNMWKQKYVV